MKPIYEMYMCNIDITNVCPTGCIYCSRFIRHLRKDQLYYMSLGEFRNALKSLEDWPGQIGISGGEPTLHPYYPDILSIIREFPRPQGRQYQLFTSGGPRYQKYRDISVGTFVCIHENFHDDRQQDICLHQPITVAVGDVIEDADLRESLIDDCWVQRTWCPVINSKGAFFCEVAGSMDIIFDGPGGYPVEPGWWKKEIKDFQEQREKYCYCCGMPVPLDREPLKTKKEKMSLGFRMKCQYRNLPKIGTEWVEIFDKRLSQENVAEYQKTWDPGNYRQDLRKDRWEA